MTQHLFRFDDTNINWQKDIIANQLFFKGVLNHANNLLNIRGHVFLNDIMDMLGMARVPQGQLEGWLRDRMQVVFQWNSNSDGSFDLTFYTSGVIYDKI